MTTRTLASSGSGLSGVFVVGVVGFCCDNARYTLEVHYTRADCEGAEDGDKVLDACGECGGDGSSCDDCREGSGSDKVLDACGVCGGDNSTCTGCDGKVLSGNVDDAYAPPPPPPLVLSGHAASLTPY